MNFYDSFVGLCNKAGKSPSKVALEIGISKSIVSRWKAGGGATDATARKVADYFGVPVSEITGKPERQPLVVPIGKPLFTGDEELLSAETLESLASEEIKKPTDQKAGGLRGTGYEKLTPENQKVIDSLIETLLNSQSRG